MCFSSVCVPCWCCFDWLHLLLEWGDMLLRHCWACLHGFLLRIFQHFHSCNKTDGSSFLSKLYKEQPAVAKGVWSWWYQQTWKFVIGTCVPSPYFTLCFILSAFSKLNECHVKCFVFPLKYIEWLHSGVPHVRYADHLKNGPCDAIRSFWMPINFMLALCEL